jgi:hypothetical protein
MLRGPADASLLQRWAWHFATKMWFMGARPEELSAGPLRPVLQKLADPSVSIQMPVMLARVHASARTWNIAGLAKSWRGAHTPFIPFIIRGVIWIVTATAEPKVVLPIPVTPLTPGLLLHKVRLIRRRQSVPLFSAPPAKFPALSDSAR